MQRHNKSQFRREEAAEKTKRAQASLDLVKYEIIDDDVRFLSGHYYGETVRNLWPKGPDERDYIISHLWNLHDEAVMSIIRSLVCK